MSERRTPSGDAERLRLFSAIIESSSDAIYTKTLDGIITSWNPGAERMYGYTAVEAIGRHIELVVPEQQRPELQQILERLRAGAPVSGVETVRRTKAGRDIDVSLTISPVRSDDGELIGSSGIARDITGRKSLEARFTLAIEAAPNGMMIVDAGGRIQYVNREIERLFGYSRDELIGSPVERLVPSPSRAAHPGLRAGFVAHPARRFMGVGRDLFGEHKDGSAVPVEIGLNPITTPDGLLVLASVVDISARKKAEDDLRRSNTQLDEARARLEHVLASSAATLLSVPLSPESPTRAPTVFSLVTEGVTRMLGYSVAEVQGPGWWQKQIHPDDLDRTLHEFENVLSGRTVSLEYRLRHADGSYRWMNSHPTVVRDYAGRPVEIVTAVIDVTSRKNLEQQFQQAQKMEAIGILAGGIAHDFNNILTAILGFAETASAVLPLDHPAAESLEEIDRNVMRAARLTRQLLAFGRQQLMEPRVLDPNSVVEGTGKLLRRVIGEDIRLTLSLGRDIRPIYVDPGQLEQVILNLALNARDAMPGGGSLTIETANVDLDASYALRRPAVKPGEYVLIAITDTGTGMNEAIQRRIFEPFFTTKEVGRGTGLGLAAVHGIVNQSNGHIWVYSEPGAGTTFKLYFPVTSEPVEPDAGDRSATPAAGGHETILVVEDEAEVRQLAAGALERHGYRVLVAANGEEAYRLAANNADGIDLLVTDVIMPLVGGPELADRLRASRPDIAIIFASGYARDAVINHGILGADSIFLQKPYTPMVLLRKVREVLDVRAARLKLRLG
ncbi:MAG TPA: PAS domain S-box protein [Gemmatimonadales bacterium]